ncbi:hypothetical protein LguiA_014756 [Lonicera macranthoides]
MANIHYFTLTIAILALTSSLAYASDPSPLQDFCVAFKDSNSKAGVSVDGKSYKNPKFAKADDFFFSGLRNAGNTSNPVGSAVTQANVVQILGLKHTWNLFSFVTSNPDNRLFTKVLNKGDVFGFPEGLIHFQLNVGKTNAIAIAGLSSQNPRVITIANAVFGSNPPISVDVLTKAFQVDKNVINYLQAQFWWDNN